MTFRLGLTGSIGMGKSTTAEMFADEGCAVWDADAAVHRLYARNGKAVDPIRDLFPAAIVDSQVSRERLKNIISSDPTALNRIEHLVHPLVARDREHFLADTESDVAVLDIPLLFETGSNKLMDAVACVSASEDLQRTRVLGRNTMNEAQFVNILSKQMPNAEKCALSDYIIRTDTLENARAQVQTILHNIRGNLTDA